jgi:glycosyltransferase involved in cell wall biosynthesis
MKFRFPVFDGRPTACPRDRLKQMVRCTHRLPRLSIGIPVYNGERYLAETLYSFQMQTFRDFEIVVCDNASTDHTAEICQSFIDRDYRIRYCRNQKNLGAIPNYNKVFGLCRAPLFKWAAHDDLYHPRYLESCVRILDGQPDIILAHSGTAFIDELGESFPLDRAKGCYIDPRTGIAHTPDRSTIANCSLPIVRFWQVLSGALWGTHMFGIVRRAMLEKTRLIANFSGGDRAMLAELALLGRFQCSEDILFSKRFHADASCHLNEKELLGWLSTDGKAYSRRARQLKSYFSIPFGKPLQMLTKMGCISLVAAHSVKTAVHAAAGRDARRAAQGLAWRATEVREVHPSAQHRH